MFKLEAILHVIGITSVILGITAHVIYYKRKDKKDLEN